MTKEFLHTKELDRQLIQTYANTFIPRTDMYPMQIADGSYITVKKRLDYEYVALHLQGKPTLGAYALDANSQAQWICLDADTEHQWHQLHRLASRLISDEIPVYLEQSRRGGHLWLLTPKIGGSLARQFAHQLLHEHEIGDIEVYPKQDELKTGPGSLVRLPFGVHRKSGRRYHFIDLNSKPIAPSIREQIALLSNPPRVPMDYIEHIIAQIPEPTPPPPLQLPKVSSSDGEYLSERIKNAISVKDFVSRYVELDARGIGRCPFHDDENPSFGVSEAGNYWSCFAGCGGGSVIDFMIKWREKNGKDASFVETIADLAKMLFES